MIFVLFDKLAKFRLSIKFLVISLIPIASFVYQCYAKEDFAHMLLLSRIWQFFVGFGAYHLRERRFFDLSQEDELSSQTIQQTSFDENKWNRRIDNTRIVLVHVLLIMFLVFGLPMNLQLQRLLVVVFTGIVVGSCSEITFVSKVRSLVVFGDISYSVYLIHWPLFTWYRYSNSEVYTNGGEPSLKTGFLLITVSIVLGYGIENAFKRFMKLIDGWKMLFFLICFLLYLNGIAIYSLRNSAVNLDEGLSDEKKPADAKQQLKRDIIMLWKTRTNPTAFTNDQITSYNSKQFQAFHGEFYCEDLNQTMPTTYPLNVKSNYQQTHTCHAKGFGAKNIILVGNSHALHNFPGVAYVFRPIYKHLTLLTRDSCLPTIRKFQATDPSLPHTNECMEFINATVPALQAWIEPIDVVMAFYAMAQNRPLEKSIEKDEYYMTMQKFFTELAEIPLEALMIMESFPIFSQVPIREVESRMKTGKPLNTVGDKPEFLRQRTPGITSRMEHIKCSNCIKLDLISFWCNRTQDNFCHSTTPQGIIYFVVSQSKNIHWVLNVCSFVCFLTQHFSSNKMDEKRTTRTVCSSALLFLVLVVVMSDSVNAKSLLSGTKSDLNLEDQVYLEDFHSSQQEPNTHVQSLQLSVSFENGTTGENEKFYTTAIENLKKSAPQLKTLSLNGGYLFNPKEDSATTFTKEAQALHDHFELLARLFRTQKLPVKSVNFVGMQTFSPKSVDDANYESVVNKSFELKDATYKDRSVVFSKQYDQTPFTVILHFSLTVLKGSDENRSRFYDAPVSINH
ncbi:hypothetical protein M3Y95_00867500 [Aphelenchoides besseyi]|nr:hypothetical protein M3Y95_00867500 [Aphelenchoides besseyi]